jgi:hypothetical protein
MCRVNAEHYEQLVSMGYSKGTAAEALRQANNDIIHALQVCKLFNGNIDGEGNINSYIVIDRVSEIEYYEVVYYVDCNIVIGRLSVRVLSCSLCLTLSLLASCSQTTSYLRCVLDYCT